MQSPCTIFPIKTAFSRKIPSFRFRNTILSLLFFIMPISNSNPLIVRIYLTSSRKYKKLRGKFSESLEVTAFYQQLVYPKFLWVAELATREKYDDEEIYGEIVLDATTDRTNPENSLICMRFLNSFSYRMPTDPVTMLEDFYEFCDTSANGTYKMYTNNLNIRRFLICQKSKHWRKRALYPLMIQWWHGSVHEQRNTWRLTSRHSTRV